MTKFKVNIHEPRTVVQKWTTITVNIKEIDDPATAEEIKEKLDAVVQTIIDDSSGQKKILEAEPKKLTNAELVQKKVVGPARARKSAKKIDAKLGA